MLLDLLRQVRWAFYVDEFVDLKLRARFKAKHNIDVGLYSYGCFDRDRIDPNTRIGRYCSFSRTAVVLNRNHGLELLTTAPYLFNTELGLVKNEGFDYLPCDIGDDVWMGHNAIVTPSARKIGRGAVLAAGAVVTKDVAPYAIVGGSPAVEIGRRFTPEVIKSIEATRWWEWDLAELAERLKQEPDMVFRPASYFGEGR